MKYRKLLKNKKNRSLIIAIMIIASIITTTGTIAYLSDISGLITNTISIGEIDVETHLVEWLDSTPGEFSLKQPHVVNDGPANAIIRVRVTVTGDLHLKANSGVELQLGLFNKDTSIVPINGNNFEKFEKLTGEGNDIFYSNIGISEFTQSASRVLTQEINKLYDIDNDGEGWLYANDGYYYYNKIISKNQSTEPIFSAVQLSKEFVEGLKVGNNLEISIYQEAVRAPNGSDVSQVKDIDFLTSAFK